MDRYKYLSIVLPVAYPIALILIARLCFVAAGVPDWTDAGASFAASMSFIMGVPLGIIHCAYVMYGEKW